MKSQSGCKTWDINVGPIRCRAVSPFKNHQLSFCAWSDLTNTCQWRRPAVDWFSSSRPPQWGWRRVSSFHLSVAVNTLLFSAMKNTFPRPAGTIRRVLCWAWEGCFIWRSHFSSVPTVWLSEWWSGGSSYVGVCSPASQCVDRVCVCVCVKECYS